MVEKKRRRRRRRRSVLVAGMVVEFGRGCRSAVMSGRRSAWTYLACLFQLVRIISIGYLLKENITSKITIVFKHLTAKARSGIFETAAPRSFSH